MRLKYFNEIETLYYIAYRFPLPTTYVLVPRSVIGPGLQPNIRSIFGVNFDTLGMMLRLEFAIIYVENVLFQFAKKHESLPGYNFVFIRLDNGGDTGNYLTVFTP